MQISQREAAAVIGARGISREVARRLLVAGLAGPGSPIGRAITYRAEAVDQVARRLSARALDLHGPAQDGLVLLRVSPLRPTVVAALSADPLALMVGPWRMSVWSRVGFQDQFLRYGTIPVVTTVSGFVVAGGEITKLSAAPAVSTGAWEMPRCTFEVRPPSGTWFVPFADTVMTGKPGTQWQWWPYEPSRVRAWLGTLAERSEPGR